MADALIPLIPPLGTPAGWLPLVFMALMGLAMLAYVILDGYDLGVGLLVSRASDEHKDVMIASIGPFWDANETWLVLAVGILLVAFPLAHGTIMVALYIPVACMLIGLTLRGVAFDFRVKAQHKHKAAWNQAFFAGSLLAALAQGYMLGMLVMGFGQSLPQVLFCLLIGICLAAGYCLLGAGWLIIKTEGVLQRRAIVWAQRSSGLTGLGLLAVSAATPLLSPRIADKWFTLEHLLGVWPIPVVTLALWLVLRRSLKRLPIRLAQSNEYGVWVPFGASAGLFILAFHGIAYSLFPWLVVDKITIWQAASAPESLMIIFVGAVVVIPVIAAYSAFAYHVFRGKAKPLKYY